MQASEEARPQMAILGQFLSCKGLHFGSVLSCLCLAVVREAVPEFLGYLKKVLKNHTAHACEGEKLGLTCRQKASISILSAPTPIVPIKLLQKIDHSSLDPFTLSDYIYMEIFQTYGSNPGLLHCRWILYHLSHLAFSISS
nr:uncharacterized protein LOC121818145 isoform X1 [Ovis aries]